MEGSTLSPNSHGSSGSLRHPGRRTLTGAGRAPGVRPGAIVPDPAQADGGADVIGMAVGRARLAGLVSYLGLEGALAAGCGKQTAPRLEHWQLFPGPESVPGTHEGACQSRGIQHLL